MAFKNIDWNKPASLFEAYLQEQDLNFRYVIIARINNVFTGYVTLKFNSEYPYFSSNNIPEIVDLNVLPVYRKQGIGTFLIDACENKARMHGYHQIGLGVGMTRDYGSAQRLYVQLGYIPDGHGLHYKNKSLNYSDKTIIDDGLQCKNPQK